jgi:hypothetical protein
LIYVYAVTEAGAKLPGCRGLDDQPLGLVRVTGVAGLYSRHDLGGFAPEPEVLWRHDRVVEAAMAAGPALPARFGTTFADPDALAAALEPVHQRLARRLERVRGCVELAVRVTLPEMPAATPRSGSDYVRTRLNRLHEREAAADRALLPLAAHAVCTHSGATSVESGTLTASYLVRSADVDEFADQVRRLAARHSELSLSCTGPWPPYSFVDGDEPPTATAAGERPPAGSEAP